MGLIAKRFAKAFCAGEDERREKDKDMRNELYERMAERRRKAVEERERVRMMPAATRRNLKCAKAFLAVLAPLTAAVAVWNMRCGLAGGIFAGLSLALALQLSGWKRLMPAPPLAVAAGLAVAIAIKYIWKI